MSYLQFKAHFYQVSHPSPFIRDIKWWKGIIRSYLNISAKGQEKLKVATEKPKETIKETIRMKQVQHGHTNLGKGTRVEAQAGE